MREIIIGVNDDNQRADRFLKKYFEKAPLSFIYKNMRKKNIKLNGKKVDPEDMLKEGDKLSLYFSDDTIDKYTSDPIEMSTKDFPHVIYEDKNIIIIDKPVGILSHSASGDYEKNIVDQMISYLIAKGDYVPRIEKSFTPAICNRLDRNTSGMLIGAKNAEALRNINEAIKKKNIKKYYLTLVKGVFKGRQNKKAYLTKDEGKNKAYISKRQNKDSKEVETDFRGIIDNGQYSLVEVDLITGRTHQIRTQLKALNHPVIGDKKYGDPTTNKVFYKDYGLGDQLLHNYRLIFHGLRGEFSYLNGREFLSEPNKMFKAIIDDLGLKY